MAVNGRLALQASRLLRRMELVKFHERDHQRSDGATTSAGTLGP